MAETTQEGLGFFDLGLSFGWAVLTPGGRVFSGRISLTGHPKLRPAKLRTELVPFFRGLQGRGLYGFEPPQIFKSRDAVASMFALESALYEVATVYGWPEPKTIVPTSLKKWATGDGRADKEKMMRACRQRWKIKDVGDDEADALLGLSWLMWMTKRVEAFPCRRGQPSLSAILEHLEG